VSCSKSQLGDLKLSGTIPAEIMKQQLQMLALGSNSFSGTIPINLDEAQSLEKLVLANNKVSGTIPEVVTELPLTSLCVNLPLTHLCVN